MPNFFEKKNIQKILNKKKIYLYGAATSGIRCALALQSLGISLDNIRFIDSNKKKINTIIFGIKTVSLDSVSKNSLILISSSIYYEIKKILKEKSYKNFFYFHNLIWQDHLKEKFSENFISVYKKVSNVLNMSIDESFTIYDNLIRTSYVKGDIAEVGVYRGGSSFILCSVAKNTKKNVYLFDTFAGLPEDHFRIKSKLQPEKKWLNNTSEKKVRDLLLKSKIDKKRIKIIKGVFPKSLDKKFFRKKFSLVHLDTDLYKSTYASLKFFYPRLSVGGCIISHDYNSYGCPGVKFAFKKFFNERKIAHKLFQISESQCILIK
jgi:hypothetical protein